MPSIQLSIQLKRARKNVTNKKLQNIVTRLIEFLAKPQQEGGQGMGGCGDSFLIKLLKELREE